MYRLISNYKDKKEEKLTLRVQNNKIYFQLPAEEKQLYLDLMHENLSTFIHIQAFPASVIMLPTQNF